MYKQAHICCERLQKVFTTSISEMGPKDLETHEIQWQVKQILADLIPVKSFVDVFAAKIQPKIASSLLRQLNLCAPLHSLDHVKRIRKVVHKDGLELSIILCLAPPGSCEWSLSNAPKEVSALVQEYRLIPFFTTLPQCEACSHEEWEDQCRLWPTSYHPNAVKSHSVINFDESQVRYISKFMRVAIKEAQLAVKAGQRSTGAAIVNSSTGLVVAVGHDETGGWMNKCCDVKSWQVEADSCNNSTVSAANKKVHPWHPLRHAVMVAIERAAERNKAHILDRSVNNGDAHGVNTQQEYLPKSSTMANQYLCTGFDAYVTHEPCAMCAMALLHQRVCRVFYGIPNLKIGALGGSYKLHGTQGLNHRYLVFHVPLSEADLVE